MEITNKIVPSCLTEEGGGEGEHSLSSQEVSVISSSEADNTQGTKK